MHRYFCTIENGKIPPEERISIQDSAAASSNKQERIRLAHQWRPAEDRYRVAGESSNVSKTRRLIENSTVRVSTDI